MSAAALRAEARRLFDAAVAAAQPAAVLPAHFPPPPAAGRLLVLAGGKAGATMAAAAEAHYLDRLGFPAERLEGLCVTRHGYGCALRRVGLVEAGHPVPDAAGEAGARRLLDLARGAGEGDLALVLVSGGASANWSLPCEGLTLDDKRAVTRAMLRSGAPIGAMNAIRKHLSAIKGGRLAVALAPAQVVTLAFSDVPGDDAAVIGSGPTVPDPTTLADARAALSRYAIAVPPAVAAALENPANETPKADHPAFAKTALSIVLRPADALRAAEAAAAAAGFHVVSLGADVEGEAREVAAAHAALAREVAARHPRAVILSGGELTVTLRGTGRGGPNQEYALALAMALGGMPGLAAISGDTDGSDGGSGAPTDPAGAIIDESTLARAATRAIDPAAMLANNDSTTFFAQLDDLLSTGPTLTNANDLRAIVIDRQA